LEKKQKIFNYLKYINLKQDPKKIEPIKEVIKEPKKIKPTPKIEQKKEVIKKESKKQKQSKKKIQDNFKIMKPKIEKIAGVL